MSNAAQHPSYAQFVGSFAFTRARGNRRMGVEEEFFLCLNGVPDPNAQQFLYRMATHTDHGDRWTYELSACQVEYRTAPHDTLDSLREDLQSGSREGRTVAGFMSRELRAFEVAPIDMTLALYPDERYAKIGESLGEQRLRAACRVAGVHVHVECFSPEDAVRVYATLRDKLVELARLGDHSNGERLRLYSQVVNGLHVPPHVESFEHLYHLACHAGWAHDLRSCWWIIRFSRHGTVEVRVFGATDDVDEVLGYVNAVLNVIR